MQLYHCPKSITHLWKNFYVDPLYEEFLLKITAEIYNNIIWIFLVKTRRGNPIFTSNVWGWQNKKSKNIALHTKISPLISSSKVTCRKSRSYNPWGKKEKKWEEKSYCFAHPAQGSTNTHLSTTGKEWGNGNDRIIELIKHREKWYVLYLSFLILLNCMLSNTNWHCKLREFSMKRMINIM